MRRILEMSDQEQLALIKRRYQEAEGATSDWRKEARELYALVAGDQWDTEDEQRMIESRRPMVTFNVSGKYIDAVTGLQITNRQEIRYYPREPGDAAVNDFMTGAADWVRDEGDFEDEESEAFLDLTICGIGALDMSVDTSESPEGDIVLDRGDPLEYYWDPRARKRNLRDRRWQMRVKLMPEEDIIDRWGEEQYQKITGDMGIQPEWDEFDVHHATEAWKYEHEPFGDVIERDVPVVEYQEYEMVDSYLVTTRYGQKTFTAVQWRKMKEVLEKNGVEYRIDGRTKQREYIRIYAAGNVILEADKSPCQDGFTTQFLTGKRDRNKNDWYGVGRAVRDPQLWLNKLFSTILHSMAAGSKGGLLAEEDAFEDPSRAEEEWASPDSITWLTQGALQNGKIKEKTPAQYPAGLDRLMEFSINSLPETTGLNMELMGMANRIQPGIVEAQRKQSAMTVIAWAFDSMRRYYKDHGRQLAYYMREYISDGRLARITTKQGAQYIPMMKDKMTAEYDVVVDEAPSSVNVKERVWLMLEGLMPHLLKMGLPIPPEVLEYSPLPPDLQEAWKKALQPDPQQQQMQQRQLQLDMAEKEAEVDKDKSTAELNRAKVREVSAKAGQIAGGG